LRNNRKENLATSRTSAAAREQTTPIQKLIASLLNALTRLTTEWYNRATYVIDDLSGL
jgi:hypothetical protein